MSNPIQNASQIQQGIDFIRAQTQPETITNEHVANVLEAMLKPRVLRNLTDSVTSGQIQLSPNDFPYDYPEPSLQYLLKQQGAEDETFELLKNSTQQITKWALGEPEYELFAKTDWLDAGLKAEKYEYYEAGGGGRRILFGRNLGKVLAGTSLGTFTEATNLYLKKSSFGQDITKENINVKVTNQIGADFPFKVAATTEFFNTKTVNKDSQFAQLSYYSRWNYLYFYFYNDTQAIITLTKNIKVEVLKNGNSLDVHNYPIGQKMLQYEEHVLSRADSLAPGDNVEIIFSEVI